MFRCSGVHGSITCFSTDCITLRSFLHVLRVSLRLYIAFDEGERIPNRVLGVLCFTARKIRDFLCNGSVVVDVKLAPPPEDFCRGLRSAGNW